MVEILLFTEINAELYLPSLAFIEASSFPKPMGAEFFLKCLENSSMSCLILLESGQVSAYLLTEKMFDEQHIIQLATHTKKRRRGYASLLLERWFAQSAKDDQIASFWLEVRAIDEKVIRFYKNHQFEVVGRRRNYYPATKNTPAIDAVLMRRIKSIDFLQSNDFGLQFR